MFELIISLAGVILQCPGMDLFLNILKVQDQMLPVSPVSNCSLAGSKQIRKLHPQSTGL